MRCGEKGFTLLELVVTIVLIGILGMAFVPGFSMTYKQDMRRAAEQICADFNTMKDQSRVTGKEYKLTIESDNKKYTISPHIIGEPSGRAGNTKDNINPNIRYSMKADGVSVTKVIYKSGTIYKTGATDSEVGAMVNKLEIILTYDGDSRIKANIEYNGVTGHYSITY